MNMNNKMSVFQNVTNVPTDPLFLAYENYTNCKAKNKINLTIGTITEPGNESNLYEFKCVSKAQDLIAKEELDKEYPPLTGIPEYNSTIQNLFFDKDSNVVKEKRILTVQAITGGAALKIGADILRKLVAKSIYLSNKTWGFYTGLFQSLEIKYYPYFNEKTKTLDFENMVSFFKNLEKGSVVNLQLNCHNPTGIDLNLEQWEIIGKICAENKIFAFIDIAYLGFSSGSIQEDFAPVRLLERLGVEMFIVYCTEKNFGTYSDPVGNLIVILNKPQPINAIR